MTTTKPNKASTRKATTTVAPHPAAEIAVTTALRSRVSVHRPRFTIEDRKPVVLAACNGKRAKSYSYGYAKTHGVVLCRKCFGGGQ